MPNNTNQNALASFGLAYNPTGPGYIAYNPGAATGSPLGSTVAPSGGPGVVGAFGESPQSLATDTSAANLNAAGNIESLTNLINNLNEQNQQMLNAGRLGAQGQGVQNQLLSNAGAQAAGQLPSDVINNALSLGAQSGAGRGFGVGDPATNAAVKRALGLDTVALQNMGQSNYLGLLSSNPSAPLYGGQNNLVSPATYASAADQLARNQLENQRMLLAASAANNRNYGGGGGGSRMPTGTSQGMTTQPGLPASYPGGGGGSVGTPDYSGYDELGLPYDFFDTANVGSTEMDPAWFDQTIGGGSDFTNSMDPSWFDYTIGGG